MKIMIIDIKFLVVFKFNQRLKKVFLDDICIY